MVAQRMITDPSEFVELVQNNNKPFVVLFSSTWCPFCKDFKRIFTPRIQDFKIDIVTVVLDELDNPLWDNFSVDVVPTMAIFSEGRIIKRINGIFGVGLSSRDLDELVKYARSLV